MSDIPRPQSDPDKAALLSAYSLVSELGFIIAAPIVLLGIGGAYLDKYLGTSPLCLLSGFLLSFFLSGMGVWNIVKRLNAEQEARDKAEKARKTDAPRGQLPPLSP